MKGERVYSGDILKNCAKCCILVLLVKCRFSTRRVNSSEVWFLRAVQKSCLRTIAKPKSETRNARPLFVLQNFL